MSIIEALKYVTPLGYVVAKTTETAIKKYNGAAETSSLEELREEAIRQEITAKVMQDQAKVEQELAIARRIDSAEEVEIEEYYDASGKGALGLKTEGEAITLGASGEGRRVTKRIIKFKGCKAIPAETIIIEEKA